ncbi:GNAT family N-acetyltransferase [Psychrobacillus sp. Sa2BUA9]|uniref:GNAT family N-acetyltransferase n=1 Tax=Psychrobacillus faecigallinarum TaxID=2762235 RepID=A0ABR8R496_9BACI|nr:GNAT family N-acetyltransferase [Psychrobacillus faecigallinarum]MBD7942593.1 GNAT family N-acetyltransferase [Psychrobacillus faecigallinarum]
MSANSSLEIISELTTKDQWIEAYPIMKQLRTDMTLEAYIDLLQEMQKDGYKLYALYFQGKIASLVGFSWRTNFYSKRHIFVYDLVTDASRRSGGYGKKLLKYIQDYAKENGAEYVALESGIQRIDAHRFYEEKLEYDKWCYSFRKTLI